MVALRPDHCPTDLDETAEAYVVGNLPEADKAAIEEHLLICAGCRAAVEEADKYVRAMRAGQGAREAKP